MLAFVVARRGAHNQFAVGSHVGRYELLLPAARGGMAEVWAARLRGVRGFRKLVAIKVLHHELQDRARQERMFLEEATLAADVHHPNVVEIFELGECNGALYLVMEWIDGESLRDIQRALSGRPLPLGVAVNLIGQCCRGLNAAHELKNREGKQLGLVHRDVSPHNIMVTYDGIAKVADFGVATTQYSDQELTSEGEVKGKIPYMAPEYIDGQPLDRRADLFALGLVLYELTTGRHPFRGESPLETVRNLSRGEATHPRELVPDFPEWLAPVVVRSVRRDRAERFQTAGEMLEALQTAVPAAFTHQADAQTGHYLSSLLAERAAQRQAAIDQALCRPTLPPHPNSVSLSGQSGTMGAVTTSGDGEADRPTLPMEALPTRNNPRRRFIWGASAIAGAAILGLAFDRFKPIKTVTGAASPRDGLAPLSASATGVAPPQIFPQATAASPREGERTGAAIAEGEATDVITEPAEDVAPLSGPTAAPSATAPLSSESTAAPEAAASASTSIDPGDKPARRWKRRKTHSKRRWNDSKIFGRRE